MNVHRLARGARRRARAAKQRGQLALLEARSRRRPPGSIVDFLGFDVRINDGRNYYIVYKDVAVRRLYDFRARSDEPRILDCGGNIGLASLFFKRRYPKARITVFEPDPSVLPYLQENIERNGLSRIEIRQEAIAGRKGQLVFYSDGKYAATLEEFAPSTIPPDWNRVEVPTTRLRDWLTEPIDFLKMNIEGAETEAVVDAADRLHLVDQLAIEYHHLPGLDRSLHRILETLHESGFDYVVHSFDEETSPGAQPPFVLEPETRYFLLVYACRNHPGQTQDSSS